MTPISKALADEGFAEEIASSTIQGAGTVLSVVGLVFLMQIAMDQGGVLPIAVAAVYGGALVSAFLSSTLYHGTWNVAAKRAFRTVDHCSIYFLIAGTYTPVALLVLPAHQGWSLVATVWVIALAGVSLRIVWPSRLHKLRIGLYVALGWLVLAWGRPVFEGLGAAGSDLLVVGGLAYTFGVPFYLWRRLPFHGSIWHLFVVLGSACHFAAIALYAIPAYAP